MDGGAERNDEVGDLVADAEALGAFQVERDRGDRRAGGEDEEHGFLHGAEELHRADASVQSHHQAALHEDGEQDAGDVAGSDGLDVGHEHVEAVLAADVGELALDDGVELLHAEHLVEALQELDRPALRERERRGHAQHARVVELVEVLADVGVVDARRCGARSWRG